MERLSRIIHWLFDSRDGLAHHLIPRWIFLRALALVYFSAFYSLLFQIDGLIGPQGILPAKEYLAAIAGSLPSLNRFWYAPSLFWLSTSSHMLMAITWLGLIAAICAFLNLWPRISLFVCFVCFLSFVSSSSDFSSYQSDGMLLEAGFIALFLAPPGLLPGWAAKHPPIRACYFLLLWEWFRIYFESGLVKILSGDPQWRNFTALDDYYQNGPLPSWIGWYVAHLPHWFHIATTGGTLLIEFVVVLMLFFSRRASPFLLHCYALADRHHPHRQLHLPQLPCALARLSAARRQATPPLCSRALRPARVCSPGRWRPSLKYR